jgi:hypothetical protein
MNYTVRDRGYFDLLGKVSEEFERADMRYALVGGTGIQVRIADLLCRSQKVSIKEVPELETLLRKTKDFDITTNSSEEAFVTFFNQIQAINPGIIIRPEGIRSKRVIARGKEKTDVLLNYQTGPQDLAGLDESFYTECIETAEDLFLKYGGSEIMVSVARPEYLIASKLTRDDPKDIWDIGMLLKTIEQNRNHSRKFKPSKVRSLLERANRGEIYGRLEEIRKQILKQ